jgi:hypothetical protein
VFGIGGSEIREQDTQRGNQGVGDTPAIRVVGQDQDEILSPGPDLRVFGGEVIGCCLISHNKPPDKWLLFPMNVSFGKMNVLFAEMNILFGQMRILFGQMNVSFGQMEVLFEEMNVSGAKINFSRAKMNVSGAYGDSWRSW